MSVQALKSAGLVVVSAGAGQDGSSASSSAALAQLQSSCEGTMNNKSMSVTEKMNVFAPCVTRFLANEAGQILGESDLQVVEHSAFGHLKKTILTFCTCAAVKMPPKTRVTSKSKGNETQVLCDGGGCSFHLEDPDLNDIMYELANAVHSLFGDDWACFCALFLHEAKTGSWPAGSGPTLNLQNFQTFIHRHKHMTHITYSTYICAICAFNQLSCYTLKHLPSMLQDMNLAS